MATILTQQKAQPIIHEINLELFDFTNKKKFQFIRGKNGLELIVDFAPLTTIKRGKIPIEGKEVVEESALLETLAAEGMPLESTEKEESHEVPHAPVEDEEKRKI